MKKPLTLEDYLAARPIADPIHLFDCVMPCAGAEAFLVCREDRARARSTCRRRGCCPPSSGTMLSPKTRSRCAAAGRWMSTNSTPWRASGPTHVDFLETYDDYPVISMMQIEDLGFCAKGEGADFVRAHTLTNDGSFPHNTSGGQLSVGQAGCAGGYLGLVEAVRQLTGDALGTPVPEARIGLVSGFGMITYDRGLASGAALLAGMNR